MNRKVKGSNNRYKQKLELQKKYIFFNYSSSLGASKLSFNASSFYSFYVILIIFIESFIEINRLLMKII